MKNKIRFKEMFTEQQTVLPTHLLILKKIVKNGGITDPLVENLFLATFMQMVKDCKKINIKVDDHDPSKDMIDAVKALSKKEVVQVAQFFLDKLQQLETANVYFDPLMDAGEWIRWATEGQGA